METIRVFPNVHIGEGAEIQNWAVIGMPPPGVPPGALETVIESGATIRSQTVIYAGSRIGSNFQTGHQAILGPGLEIGEHCSVGTHSIVAGYARISERSRIHGFCTVGAFAILEEKAWVGAYNIIESQAQKNTVISTGAILGNKVHVLPGVYVGTRALVGSKAILTKDIPPYRVVTGNPPRALRNIAQLNCPYKLIDRPYELDLLEQNDVLANAHVKTQNENKDDTWRYHLWESLGCPEGFLTHNGN